MFSQIIFAYFQLLNNLAELLGAEQQLQLKFDILGVIKFEIALAAVSTRRVLYTCKIAKCYELCVDWLISMRARDLLENIAHAQTLERRRKHFLSANDNATIEICANYKCYQLLYHFHDSCFASSSVLRSTL